jgi:hypothetical protein
MMRWWQSITTLAAALASVAATGAEPPRGKDGNTAARDEPVAVVKEVSDPDEVDAGFMDYLYKDREIDLGENIKLTIVYLAGCRAETLTGGRVVIGARKSRVTDGEMTHEKTACSQAETVTTAQARRAGAAVVREGEEYNPDDKDKEATSAQAHQARSEDHDPDDQSESGQQTRWRIQGLQPFFKWQEQGMNPPFNLEVIRFSGEPPRLMWQTTTRDNRAHYPGNAPALAVNTLYRVRVKGAEQESLSATFVSEKKESSRDDPMAELVPLGR